MNLEKLGMMLLSQYLSQFEGVKTHLSRALGECIKAAEETLKLVQRGSEQTSLHPVQNALLSKLFSPLEMFLRHSGNRLSPNPAQASVSHVPPAAPLHEHLPHTLKHHIIQSLVDTLEEEIHRVSASEAIDNPLRIQALETVKQVLLDHEGKGHSSPSIRSDLPTRPSADSTSAYSAPEAGDEADALIFLHAQDMLGARYDERQEPEPTALQVAADHDDDVQILEFRQIKTA